MVPFRAHSQFVITSTTRSSFKIIVLRFARKFIKRACFFKSEGEGPANRFKFSLGYLRGRSFPFKIPALLPKTSCYHYSIQVTRSEKSSRRDEVSTNEVSIPCLMTLYGKEHRVLSYKKKTTVTFLKIVSQNAPDCIIAHTHSKHFGGVYPPDPPRKLLAFSSATRDFSS